MGIFKEKRPEDAHEAEQLQLLNPLEPPLEVFRGYARNEQAVLSFQSKVFNVKEVGGESVTDPRTPSTLKTTTETLSSRLLAVHSGSSTSRVGRGW